MSIYLLKRQHLEMRDSVLKAKTYDTLFAMLVSVQRLCILGSERLDSIPSLCLSKLIVKMGPNYSIGNVVVIYLSPVSPSRVQAL